MKRKISKGVTLGVLSLFGVACLVNVNNFKKSDAYGYKEGFSKVGGLDFTSESQITHERDESKAIYTDKLAYWSYAGDLLSIVDEPEAASGKACLVATGEDYPRMKFDKLQTEYLYKVSYKTKLADPSQWRDIENAAFGISPYINFDATDGDGNYEGESGHDFHRNYADVRYSPADVTKVTEFYFDTVVVGTKNGARLKARLYDTLANAKAQNAADYYQFKDDGMVKLGAFSMAFYQQGLLKDLSYEIYDFTVSCFGANDGRQKYDCAWELNMDDPIVTDGGNAADNPGKFAVNGKDDYLSIETVDSEKAIKCKDSNDYPRLRLNDSVIGNSGTYEFQYYLRMMDESKWNSSWGMTPYIEFTAYNGNDWNNPGGKDFHCEYKDVQFAYTEEWIEVTFFFRNKVVGNHLVIELFGTMDELLGNLPTDTIVFPDTYNQFAAFDIALYKQGGSNDMPFAFNYVYLLTVEEKPYEPAIVNLSGRFNKEAQVLDFSDPEVVITDGTGKSAADKPGTICVNNKSDYLTTVEDSKDKVSGTAVAVKDSNDYPRIRFNGFENNRPYKISYDLAMQDQEAFNSSWVMSPYLNIIVHCPGTESEWRDLGGLDFHCGYKDVKYEFSNKYFTVEFYIMTYASEYGFYIFLFSDATAMAAGVPTETYECPEETTEIGALDMAMYKQGGSNNMPYRIANCGMWTTCLDSTEHVDADENGVCDYCGAVVEKQEPVVTLDSISASGAKSEFTVGDTFSTEGLKVTAHYSDGSTKDVTTQATIDSSKVDMASAGTYNINITFEGKSTSYDVVVKDKKVDPEPTPEKKGCGGSIITASALVSCLAIAGAALVLNKKKED